jgi:hypothetical protein
MLHEEDVVRLPSRQTHRGDGEKEKGGERYGERVVAQERP